MFLLRDYQDRAIGSIILAIREGKKRILLTAATGSGKTILVAELARRMMAKGSETRMLILCHRSEILQQNEAGLRHHGVQDVGMYCAMIDGRKETSNRIILASPQSLGRNPEACGKFDVVIADECHLLPPDTVPDAPSVKTQYGKILQAIEYKWLIGLTGSPYRMDSTYIYGKGKQFEVQADSISTSELQSRGFLVPHILPRAPAITNAQFSVNKATGDFDVSEMELAFSPQEIVDKAVDEWWKAASDRRCSLFFCCSIKHAEMVAKSITRYTDAVIIINGETETKERKQAIADAKEGKYKAIVNVDVLTTGTDIPIIDCIVFLRATQSTSLWIQAVGRALRLYPGKENALILDMAGNWQRFDGIDDPLITKANAKIRKSDSEIKVWTDEPDAPKGYGEEIPLKDCPECAHRQPVGVKVCKRCGYVFISHNFTPEQFRQIAHEGWKLATIKKISWNDNYQTKKGRMCKQCSVIADNYREYKFYLMTHEESGSTGVKGKHQRWEKFLRSNPHQIFIRTNAQGFLDLQNMEMSL